MQALDVEPLGKKLAPGQVSGGAVVRGGPGPQRLGHAPAPLGSHTFTSPPVFQLEILSLFLPWD